MPYIIFSIAVFLTLLIILISYISYRIAFGGGKCVTDAYIDTEKEKFAPFCSKIRKNLDRLYSVPYEEVRIKSQDGLTLYAKYYHIKDGAPVQIQMHGYRSMAERDFSGGFCEALNREHNILLVDERAHGKSEGKCISFGAKECIDCTEWIKYINERFSPDTPIILYGVSMGAATVLCALRKGLPENVRGIVADSPYTCCKDIVMKVGRDRKIPMRIMMPFVRLGALIFGGFDINDASAIDSVGNASVPILLIHGKKDSFVPHSMSEKIYEKNNKIRFCSFPDADHCLSYIYDTERYSKEVNDFIDEVTKQQ